MARRKKNWRKHLNRQRRLDRYAASQEAKTIEYRLRAALPAEAWDEIEAKWEAMDDEDAYLPQQRRDFLVAQARQHGCLDLVPATVLGG